MKNITVLITGASGGIGSVMAAQFAEQGANVIIHYNKNQDKAEVVLSTIANGNHMTVGCNLSCSDDTERLVQEVFNKHDKVDVLVNNAGLYIEHPIKDLDFSTWQKRWKQSIETNLLGPANLTFLIANKMIEAGGGKIINISSRGAFRGEPTAPAYGASKAGMNAMGQSLAIALAPHRVYIYTIAPGFVETAMARPHLTGDRRKEIMNQSPTGRVAKPEEVAKTAVFLASEGTDFLTGCIIDVNGASYLRS